MRLKFSNYSNQSKPKETKCTEIIHRYGAIIYCTLKREGLCTLLTFSRISSLEISHSSTENS